MRTREQERLKKQRQRERQKRGEWYALVDIEADILSTLVLFGLVGQPEARRRDRAAIKAAIGTLIDRYVEGAIDRRDHIDQWRYRDPLLPSGKSQARRKLEQRRRREDGEFLLKVLITEPLVGALVRDGYVSDRRDHAKITEGLALMLWEIATCAAMPMPRDQYGVFLW